MHYERQEHRLLAQLLRAAGPVSYEMLSFSLGSGARKDDRRELAVAMSRLRKALPPLYRVDNLRNFGYTLVEPPTNQPPAR